MKKKEKLILNWWSKSKIVCLLAATEIYASASIHPKTSLQVDLSAPIGQSIGLRVPLQRVYYGRGRYSYHFFQKDRYQVEAKQFELSLERVLPSFDLSLSAGLRVQLSEIEKELKTTTRYTVIRFASHASRQSVAAVLGGRYEWWRGSEQGLFVYSGLQVFMPLKSWVWYRTNAAGLSYYSQRAVWRSTQYQDEKKRINRYSRVLAGYDSFAVTVIGLSQSLSH